MAVVVFYIKLVISIYILYKLIRNTLVDRREKNALLLFVISFILIFDMRSILLETMPQDTIGQLAELFFLLYFLYRLTGEKAKSSPIMRNFVDIKTIFDSEIIERLDEGVALIRSDTLEILASNPMYQTIMGTGNAFVSLPYVVSALLRGEENIEIIDFQNEKRTVNARLISYGKRYALLYLKDVSDVVSTNIQTERLINDLYASWENSPSLIMLRNTEGRIIFINDAMAHFLHKSKEALLNRSFSEIYDSAVEYAQHQLLHSRISNEEIPYFKGVLKFTYPLRSVGYLQCEERLFTWEGTRHILTTGADITQQYFLELLNVSFQIIHMRTQEPGSISYVVADFIHYDILFKERLSMLLHHQITSLGMFINGLSEEDQTYFLDISNSKIPFHAKTITYQAQHHFFVEQIIRSTGGHILGISMKYLNPEVMAFNLPHIGSMIMNHIKEGVIIVNVSGQIEYANEMIHRILNYEPKALLGKNILDISMGLTIEMLTRNIEMSKQHSSLHFERIYLTKDNVRVPAEVIAMNLKHERSDMLLMLVRDISEKFIYKKRLIDSQSRYAQIFDSLQDSILEIQLPEKSINIYREFDSEKGLIGLEMSFLGWLNSIHDLDRSIVYEAVDIITSEKSTNYNFEYRFFKNGGWQWFRATGKYIDAEDGASIVIINQNISEIKTITQKLMESRVILTESERIANMAHWKFLVSKNLFAVSQTFGSVFQHKENVEEIYFESLLESIYPVDLDFFKLKFEKFIWNNENLDIIFRLHNRGKITYVNMIGQVYYDDENLPIYAIGSVADVTERMLVKQRFEESRTLLEHVVEQIPMGIVVIRNNGIIEKINSQAVQLLKLEAAKIERTEDLILHIMMRGDNLDLTELETLFNPTISTKMEQTFAMKDQTHLRLSSSHMKDADQHFLGRIINITLVETPE